MINVNQMTAAFAKMPDAALKQYATMHKNDPYTLSLVMSESNRRKQIRDGAQGQVQPQPTVVDQELAQMGTPPQGQMPQGQMPQGQMPQGQALPENRGIGMLPQQPMSMAEGGIVSFSDGGKASWQYDLEDLQNQNSPAVRPDAGSAWDAAQRAFLYNSDIAAQQAKATAMGASSNADRGNFPGQGATGTNAPVVPDITGAADKDGIKDLAATPRAAAPAVPQKSYEDYFKASMKAAGKDPFEQETKNINAAAEERKEEELTAFKQQILDENKDMFKGREERIGKREVALEKSKDVNTGMAFLQAGLAMMQARGPGLAGIAQGAGVGLGVYGEGIAKIKSAQEKLDEARDRIDELRQNKSSMDKREIRAKESGIHDLVTQGQRDLLAGKKQVYSDARALAGTTAASKVATGEAALDRQNRIAVARMPGAQQQMLTALGGKGGLEAGLTKMQEIQADKTGAAYAKMFTEVRADALKNGLEPPTATAFAASLRNLAAALNPGKVPALSSTPTGAVIP